MGNDTRKRQMKLERRAAKRKEKRQVLVRRQSVGLAEQLAAATHCPILHSWITDSLDSEGIGQAAVSRQLADGSVAVASFLVDRYCLGVKDAFAKVTTRSDYEYTFREGDRLALPSRSVSPADVRKLVEDAVAYARSFGIAPHADYARARILLGSIDAGESLAVFEFGRDGKPFFVQGPNDTPARCRQIIALLKMACGPGQYDFLLVASEAEFGQLLPDQDGLEPGDFRDRGLRTIEVLDAWDEDGEDED